MKEIIVFIAGSKKLEAQRDATRACLAELSNRHSDNNVLIKTFTFEDFSRTFVDGGRQTDYNQFIATQADYVIFIIEDTLGSITLSEFEVAMDAFEANGKPQILVYCNSTNGRDCHDEIIKRIDDAHQYYVEYKDTSDLKLQIKADFSDIIRNNIITDKGNNRQNDLTLNDKADYAVKLGASLHMYTFAAMVGQLKEQIEAYENIVSSCKTFGVAVPVPMPTSIVNVQTEVIENFVKSLSERIGKEFASIVEITLRISLITTFGTYDRDGKDAAINDIRKNTHARCSDLLSSANFSKEIVDKILNPSQNRSLLQELTAYYRTYDKKVVLCDCGNRHRIGHGCMYCGRK